MANQKLSINYGWHGKNIYNLGIFNCNMFDYQRVCVVLMFSTIGFTCYLDFSGVCFEWIKVVECLSRD